MNTSVVLAKDRLVEYLLPDGQDADSGLFHLRLPEHDGECLDDQSAESAGNQEVLLNSINEHKE